MSWRPRHNTTEHWCYCRTCEKAWAEEYTKHLPPAPYKRLGAAQSAPPLPSAPKRPQRASRAPRRRRG